jgi:hypothetical protein
MRQAYEANIEKAIAGGFSIAATAMDACLDKSA